MISERQQVSGPFRNIGVKLTYDTLDVRASVVMRAEWRRVLNAIIVPEFMDVWLAMPGIERLECRAENELPGDFRIDAFVAGIPRKIIHGACIRSKPDEIYYLWGGQRTGTTGRSVVKMLLKSGPRRCSLHLKHYGLRDQNERDWYSMMWQASLNKLRGLMERRTVNQ